MAETTPETPELISSEAKAKFAKALEEARAGAKLLGQQAKEAAGAYKDKYKAQLSEKSEAWLEDAKGYSGQAKEKAGDLAEQGKGKASDALASIGKLVADNAGAIDGALGSKYGDYARTAAKSIQETAAKLETKDLGELGDDARKLVRKNPAVTIGAAVVAGFLLARLFRGGSSDE